MSWKFWKKKSPVTFNVSRSMDIDIPVVSMGTLFRWYCYDLDIADPNKVAASLGLSGLSEDVEEMERSDSNERLESLSPLLPFLKAIAQLNSLVISHFQSESLKEMLNLPDEDVESATAPMREVLGQISMSALIAGFSAALSLGVVKSNNIETEEVSNEQR